MLVRAWELCGFKKAEGGFDVDGRVLSPILLLKMRKLVVGNQTYLKGESATPFGRAVYHFRIIGDIYGSKPDFRFFESLRYSRSTRDREVYRVSNGSRELLSSIAHARGGTNMRSISILFPRSKSLYEPVYCLQ
jgi:hypothetical protein